jgi:hypothetical protein
MGSGTPVEMGGRGQSAGYFTYWGPAPDLEELPYNVISYDTPLGGAVYPFLVQTGRAWHLLTRPVGEAVAYHPAHTLGLSEPTLRWVGADSVTDLYVDGMTTAEFLAASGLELNLDKGAYVLSKRLSRLMRPHFVSGHFEPSQVQVAYMDELDEDGRKVWDGAGLISRAMLQKLALSGAEEMVLGGEMSPARRARLERELATAGRVEFTLMTAAGQDKGHAIVADDLRDQEGNPVDFLLPQDTKREIRLLNDRTFVGLDFIHGHDHMRLDIQSLINLYPFFNEKQLLGWLRDEGELFTQAVESGAVAEAMARVDRHTTLAEVQKWHLREYFVSGGHPLWFGSHVKSLMNQHLERLNHASLKKLRLPIPGGRYYVMPAGVGARAGLALDVPEGHIHLDKQTGTAWVNDRDWLALPDSPRGAGIAGILGGADNDDALWLHPFTDHDGARKVLAWRSPNQVGEYVVLKPAEDCRDLLWTVPAGELVSYPAADSRCLPPRVDRTTTRYLGLVDPATAGGLGEGEAYRVKVMGAAIERALQNKGALGMYCNSLMLNKAVYGRLPDNPPAPLEDIIDSSVKTGADLSRVVGWNYDNSRRILAGRTPIPKILHGRLSFDPNYDGPRLWPVRSSNHWLDRLERGVREHIGHIQSRRDALVKAAMPPRELFDSVLAEPELVRLGAGLNQTYARTLKRLAQSRPFHVPAAKDFDAARHAAQDYLARFPPPQQNGVLRGAMVSAYLGETPASDTAVWLAGARQAGGRAPGIGRQSLAALREIGLLNELNVRGGRVVAYPNTAPLRAVYRTVGIQGVWYYRFSGRAGEGDEMRDVPKTQRQWARKQTEELAGRAAGMTLSIKEENGRQWAYTADGRLLGAISRDSEAMEGERLAVRGAVAGDGSLRVVVDAEVDGDDG